MLAPTLRRDRGSRAFHQLQESLLHTLARDIARDRGVFRLARNLVDLVNIDDAMLRLLDIIVGGLEQLEDDILNILAHIARFGQSGRIGHSERHIKRARQRLREQGLTRAGRADEQDVGLGQLDIAGLTRMLQPLVMIVHRDRKDALGAILPDHIIIEHLANVRG